MEREPMHKVIAILVVTISLSGCASRSQRHYAMCVKDGRPLSECNLEAETIRQHAVDSVLRGHGFGFGRHHEIDAHTHH